jgi:hypothetical protein
MTDNITLPRDVGLHIRNSLRGIVNASDDDCGEEKCRECAPVRVMRESLAALDAALAEPTETFAESLFRRSWEAHRAALAEPDAICSAKDNEAALERVANRVKPGQVKGLLPEPEQKPEPVAWMESPHGAIRANPLYRITAPQSLAWSIPLYTHLPAAPPEPPAKREPATHKQMVEAHGEMVGGPWFPDFKRVWRAAERFHGITKEDA